LTSAGAPPQTPLEELTALRNPAFKGRGKEGKGRGRRVRKERKEKERMTYLTTLVTWK